MQISLCLGLFLTFTALQAQQYTLNLSSPSHAGERYSFSAKATKLEQIIAAEHQVKSEEYRVEFEGQAEVLEVDAKGQPFKIGFTVERFTRLDGTETTELLKSGSVIVADGSQPNYLTLTRGHAARSRTGSFRPASCQT